MEDKFKSGFVSIVGRPNVGKSTLVNHIVGEKISIVSDKIQTTRHRIHGILTHDDAQIVFVDTPGVHKPLHELGDVMVNVSLNALKDVDLVLFVINAKEGYGKGDQFIMDQLKDLDIPVFLVVNKIDLVHPDELLPLITLYNAKFPFAETIPVSALDGNNVERLISVIKSYLPEGPKYYHPEDKSDRPKPFRIGEIIREKVLFHTEEEIPHSVNVIVEAMDEKEHIIHIHELIITERPSQKAIIIGKNGRMLKRIGQEARKELEMYLGKKVNLKLWVKVVKDWRNRRSLLAQYGFDLE